MRRDREKGDFELKDEYDFTDGIRGKFYKPQKVCTAAIIDANGASCTKTAEEVNDAI
ncbi:MAG: hypothetical protein HQL06_01315 [Nitrospirae bacterium]|nr:hypothetical protein [Nitrospirota bacterium]